MRTGGITVTAVLGDAEFGDNATRRSLPGWQRHVGLTNERFFVGTDNKGTATADDDVKLVKLDPDGRDAWWAIEDSDPLAIASEPETGSPPARSCPKLSCAGPLGKDRRQRLLHELRAEWLLDIQVHAVPIQFLAKRLRGFGRADDPVRRRD